MQMPLSEFFSCASCKPFSDCFVPMVAGLVGGSVQFLKSKNYSFIAFASGMTSSLSVAMVFCWFAKDITWFSNRQSTVNGVSWILGISSSWVIDVAIPKIREMLLSRIEKWTEKWTDTEKEKDKEVNK